MDIDLILLALTVTYLTNILLLERKDDHFGPLQSKDNVVFFNVNGEDTQHVQPVTLFDWIRRPFGVYKIKQHVWEVQEEPSQRWTCPICLSFWIALALVLIYIFVPKEYVHNLFLVFSIACVSSILNVNLL